MQKYRVTKKAFIKTEAGRVSGICLTPKFIRVRWTPESLRQTLTGIGLEYSKQEIADVLAELETQGVLETASEAEATPE